MKKEQKYFETINKINNGEYVMGSDSSVESNDIEMSLKNQSDEL